MFDRCLTYEDIERRYQEYYFQIRRNISDPIKKAYHVENLNTARRKAEALVFDLPGKEFTMTLSRPHLPDPLKDGSYARPDILVRAAELIRSPRKCKVKGTSSLTFNQSLYGRDVVAFIALAAKEAGIYNPPEDAYDPNEEIYQRSLAEQVIASPLGYLVAAKWPCSVFDTPKKANIYMAHQPSAKEAAEQLKRIARNLVTGHPKLQEKYPDLVPDYLKESR